MPEAPRPAGAECRAQILGVTARATTILAGDRVTKSHRNTVVGGLWAGIEHLVLLATEVEDRFHAIPSLACAADMAAPPPRRLGDQTMRLRCPTAKEPYDQPHDSPNEPAVFRVISAMLQC